MADCNAAKFENLDFSEISRLFETTITKDTFREEFKVAYRTASKKLHPDQCSEDSCKAMYQQIQSYHDIIKCFGTRKEKEETINYARERLKEIKASFELLGIKQPWKVKVEEYSSIKNKHTELKIKHGCTDEMEYKTMEECEDKFPLTPGYCTNDKIITETCANLRSFSDKFVDEQNFQNTIREMVSEYNDVIETSTAGLHEQFSKQFREFSKEQITKIMGDIIEQHMDILYSAI